VKQITATPAAFASWLRAAARVAQDKHELVRLSPVAAFELADFLDQLVARDAREAA
jgi:hypothetical protein